MQLIPYRNKNNKWGYCDTKKNIVIPCKYDQTFPFWNKMPVARVLMRGEGGIETNGMVDQDGQEIIPVEYDHIGDGGCLIDEDGMISLEKNGLYGYINQQGNIVVEAHYSWEEAYKRKPKRISEAVNTFKNVETAHPFANVYDSVDDFQDGIARVSKDNKWGYINESGQEIIPLVYDSIDNFLEDLVVAEKDDKVGFLNRQNQVVIPFKYSDAWGFYQGISGVMIDRKLCFINKEAQIIKETPFNVMSAYLPSGVIRVEQNNKWGLIDRQGNLVTPIHYDVFTDMGEVYSDFKDDRMLIKRNGMLGYINRQGKEIIPAKYLSIFEFSEDLAVVRIPDPAFESRQNPPFGMLKSCVALFGFIDRDGNEVIPLKYRLAHSFYNGLAFVENIHMECGYINRQGLEFFE